jgi:SAM-dependent methyltransferase
MPYPPELVGALPLRGGERALDVGCGPGSLTLLLAKRVAHVIGIDADPDMIAAADEAAQRAGIGNVEWRPLRAEELPADLGRFDLVTFAQSFHWLDRAAVAHAVRGMLEPGGMCVHVGATTHRGDGSEDPLSHPRPPYERIDALVRSYLGPVRRAGAGSLPGGTVSGESEVFRTAGFTGPERIELDTGEVVTRSADEVVAATFSLSSAAPHLFGDRLGEFERDLRALLAGGVFAERRRSIALEIWR